MFSACYVFIAVSNGIIEEVTFFDAEEKAIWVRKSKYRKGKYEQLG